LVGNQWKYDERGRKNHDFYTLYTALPQQIRKDIEGQFVILLEKREMIDVLVFCLFQIV
jgi:hypothetical protein